MQRPKKIYPDLTSVCARFRFVPDEPPILPRIMQHLALHSIKQEGAGFVWKFDEKPVGSVGWEQVAEGELLKDIEMPMDSIAGEFSEIVPPALSGRLRPAPRAA